MNDRVEKDELQELNQGLNRFLSEKEGTAPPMEVTQQPSGWSRLRSVRRTSSAGRNRQRAGGKFRLARVTGTKRILACILMVVLGIAVCVALIVAIDMLL